MRSVPGPAMPSRRRARHLTPMNRQIRIRPHQRLMNEVVLRSETQKQYNTGISNRYDQNDNIPACPHAKYTVKS